MAPAKAKTEVVVQQLMPCLDVNGLVQSKEQPLFQRHQSMLARQGGVYRNAPGSKRQAFRVQAFLRVPFREPGWRKWVFGRPWQEPKWGVRFVAWLRVANAWNNS